MTSVRDLVTFSVTRRIISSISIGSAIGDFDFEVEVDGGMMYILDSESTSPFKRKEAKDVGQRSGRLMERDLVARGIGGG